MKRWIMLSAMIFAGVVLHDVWAGYLVDERLAGVLLSAGAGARPIEALTALFFVAFRLICLPLSMAVVAMATVRALEAAWTGARGRGGWRR